MSLLCFYIFVAVECGVPSVGKVVSRPKFAEQISVEVGEQNVIFTGIIFFQNMESKTE